MSSNKITRLINYSVLLHIMTQTLLSLEQKVKVRPLKKGEEDIVEGLFMAEYGGVFIDVDSELETARKYLDSEHCLVAELDGEIVGFATFYPFNERMDIVEAMNKYYFPFALGDRVITRKFKESPHYQTTIPYGDEVRAAFGHLTPIVNPTDILLRDLIVRNDLRRHKIGSRLATEAMEVAKQRGADVVYLYSIGETGSLELFQGRGFFRVMTLGPSPKTGRDHTFMGYLLKD